MNGQLFKKTRNYEKEQAGTTLADTTNQMERMNRVVERYQRTPSRLGLVSCRVGCP